MYNPIIGRLILKDWRLNRLLLLFTLAAGFIALAISQSPAETAHLLGAVWFFVALCVLGSMLPASTILNERKKQTLPFVMSLPVSAVQYGIAKVVSVWAMFLVPWLILLISALMLIEKDHANGAIPMTVMLAMLPLIGFCLISASALVGESEGWLIAVSIVCNSSYWLGWYSLARSPSLTVSWKGSVAIWSSTAQMVFAGELALIVLILVLTLILQSRKRDFI
jgi:ABC-2 type transport system permease protein